MAWSFLISLPGVGNIVLATLLAEAWDTFAAMTVPCAAWRASRLTRKSGRNPLLAAQKHPCKR